MPLTFRSLFHTVYFLTFTILLLAHVISIPAHSAAQEKPVPPFSFLSTTITGAHDFIQTHPEFDGRGVVIFILDTGVDMGIPGLQKTPDGKAKVIDARDFTGQGDVWLDSVRISTQNGEDVLELNGEKLYRPGQLPYQPEDGVYWMGFFDEARFKNSSVKDINENGVMNEKFGIISFPVCEAGKVEWVAFIDLDNDRQLDDEKPVHNYNVNQESFQFTTQYAGGGKNSLTFALHVYPGEKRISFHFDDGFHGTHVAGIAAGFKINGEDGFNGIAPGARIISLKIGDNTLTGGATVSGSMKKAFEFVMDYGKTHDVPVVVNMSYGIGSEIAGESRMEVFLDEILSENDRVVVCISAGNEGPGIATMGNPAGAERVIASAGLLPSETGKNLLSTFTRDDLIFFFSSRGGENAKPDVVSPAYATSTVPRFSPGEKYGGTSMASPQTTGAAALLLSALRQEYPDLPYTNLMVKRAMKNSAKELSAYTMLDQGAGLLRIPEAYLLLTEYAKQEIGNFKISYDIETENPSFPDGTGETAYWRTGGFVPNGKKEQNFSVKAVFPEKFTPAGKENYFRSFYLKSTQPWLKLNQSENYLKEDHATNISVFYDTDYFRQPGLYTGKVIAYERKGNIADYDRKSVLFELWNTIIVPYQFTPDNGFSQYVSHKRLEAGRIDRYFVHVPPGASAMHAALAPSPGSNCSVRPHLFTPEGKEWGGFNFADESNTPVEISIPAGELIPGDWEIDVYAGITNAEVSVYDLNISFSGILSEPEVIGEVEYVKGEKPGSGIILLNQFLSPFIGSARGEIDGFLRETQRDVKQSAKDTYDFQVTNDIEKVEFYIEFSKDEFNKFTDIAAIIVDEDGRIVVSDAFSYRSGMVEFRNPAPGGYSMEIIGGFAFPEDERDWQYRLEERYYRDEKIDIRVTVNNDEVFTLYSGYPLPCRVELEEAPRITPAGFECFGSIRLTAEGEETAASIIPIRVKLSL